ncbi:interleukin-5 receptor subunit alpha-like isoform X2 [Ictalurus furcatus]|uniref:interleukin-5 receptor subunit alpha-like isoform X2 n=1 Tax=Ictalurus furcatus TaxID=66913 RepID=UPI002350BFA5|nr:interleukin-5 receptor subunit alpha-like isoform X2 [Ictalurus furcatus]
MYKIRLCNFTRSDPESVTMPAFTMRLCGLLLTLSVVLAYEKDICDICEEAQTSVILKNHENHINSSLPEIQCLIYNVNLLSCSWSTDSLAEDAQYSASFQFCSTTEDHPLNCISGSLQKFVECQGQIKMIDEMDETDVAVKVNISINGYWYSICHVYDLAQIEKLDAPQNITTVIKSTNLEIQWLPPRSCCFQKQECFIYELKINNEKVEDALKGMLAYNKTNFEPTRSYTIQIRVKQSKACASAQHWSDWSEAVVVSQSRNIYHLNASVIASIAFVLPMILLAIFLVCKFQRLFEKLFPSIPNPSKNVQMLLEKNEFNQVIPPKQIEGAEEGAEILEVIG